MVRHSDEEPEAEEENRDRSDPQVQHVCDERTARGEEHAREEGGSPSDRDQTEERKQDG